MKTLYTAHAIASAGREGSVQTDDGAITEKLSAPGSGAPGTNPEQLFACGYAACFGSAVAAVAKKQKIEMTTAPEVHSEVKLNQDDSNGYFISVTLNVLLPELDEATGKKLVEAAHQVCPYSKATRGNIEVKLNVNEQPLSQAA